MHPAPHLRQTQPALGDVLIWQVEIVRSMVEAVRAGAGVVSRGDDVSVDQLAAGEDLPEEGRGDGRGDPQCLVDAGAQVGAAV